jgi:MFS family permease
MYGFGRYEKDLKTALDKTQSQVQTLGIVLDCGNYIGHPVVGMFYDKFGSRRSSMAAAAIVFAAFVSIQQGVSHPNGAFGSAFFLAAGFFSIGLGSGLGYIAALGTTAKVFADTGHKSKAIGIVSAGFGLSSTLVGVSYSVGIHRFFFLWACLGATVNLLSAWLLHSADMSSRKGKDFARLGASIEGGATRPKRSTFCLRNFWLLFVSFMMSAGCGLFVINNVSTMAESIGGDDNLSTQLVITLSMCSCAGRLAIGLLGDRLHATRGFIFSCHFGLVALVLLVSSVVYQRGESALLFFTVSLIAFAYGASWVLVVRFRTRFLCPSLSSFLPVPGHHH